MTNQGYKTPAGIMQLTGYNGGEDISYFEFFGGDVEFEDEECTPITPANPLAPQMLQYAYDAFEHEKPWLLWELRPTNCTAWAKVTVEASMWVEGYEYRRIEPKKTFMCNGVELVDDRVVESHCRDYKDNTHWAVDFAATYSVSRLTTFLSSGQDALVKRGLAHHTKEGAIAHAKALSGEE